eukprot:GDKH01025538.1.p1 GENE.GDKH01025538.1~~GDKH01025538.1.p1  ORF type:complete len:105 (-),score=11.23 GDKH01025538.1:141-455(-)
MNNPHDSLHVRVKRKNQTIFVLLYPDQKAKFLKERISRIIAKEMGHFRLMLGNVILDEESSVKAQRIQNGDIVNLVYKIEGKEEYEAAEYDSLTTEIPVSPATE